MKWGTRNVTTRGFREMYLRLSGPNRELARAAYRAFRRDPSHPGLRAHELKPTHRGRHLPNSVSVSISMKYRAICRVEGDVNVWYWIGSHNAYENYIGRK